MLALLICFAVREDGVEMRGEDAISAVGAAELLGGLAGFGPPGEMQRIESMCRSARRG